MIQTLGGHRIARSENTVPFFWPLEFSAVLMQREFDLVRRGWKTLAEAEKLDFGLTPQFSSTNTVIGELHTLRLRDFSTAPEKDECPTLIDAPFAGHSAVIADFRADQSLVATLLANGCSRVLLTDWKSATHAMKDYDIDNYLAELNVCIDDLGGRVNLVGLCQGGWMSAMFAARFPNKVRKLVLAGAPIDTDAGDGPIKHMAHALPLARYRDMIEIGGGLMRGRFMLDAWKAMHPGEQYVTKYIDLYAHIDDPDYVRAREAFEAWYENPIDLPGRWYLQAVQELFQENRLAKGTFTGLGRRLSLKDVTCPTYLLAGAEDDITPPEQVFGAAAYLGTPQAQIARKLTGGGHIGLFMGARALSQCWPQIARWLAAD